MMSRLLTIIATASLASLAISGPVSSSTTIPLTATDTGAVAKAQQTELTLSPTSQRKGRVFDRYVNIILENTNFQAAVSEPNFQKFISQGILLTNYFGTTHPSKPNYIAQFGGDNFGADDDSFTTLPFNVSNLWDVLEDGGVSFGFYSENQPYTGFEGSQFLNATNGKNDYVRKHNCAVQFTRNTQNPRRLAVMKNFTMLYEDMKNDRLPQHMVVVPNEQNDGHDTGIAFASNFLVNFIPPLLANKNFNKNTLVVISFDESGTDSIPNNIATILLGSAVPKHLQGTTDGNYYTHYSGIATVEANWDLHHLGRYDCGANVYKLVADVTHDKIRAVANPNPLNSSYPGALSSAGLIAPIPAPDIFCVANGRTILPTIFVEYALSQECQNYNGAVMPADGSHPPAKLPAICAKLPGPPF